MKYMLLLWGDEGAWENQTPEEAAAEMEQWNAYTEGLVAANAMVSGEGLQPSATATTVRVAGGQRQLTDGPFAETKEQLGGFYVIDCPSLDEALDWAAKVPSVAHGSVEVRPVLDYEAVAAGGSDQSEGAQS